MVNISHPLYSDAHLINLLKVQRLAKSAAEKLKLPFINFGTYVVHMCVSEKVHGIVLFACRGSDLRSIEMGLCYSAEVDPTIHLCVHIMGSSEKVDDHTGRPAAMHMLQNNHKFTITLPLCLRRRLQGVSVFPLSSLLQKDKS